MSRNVSAAETVDAWSVSMKGREIRLGRKPLTIGRSTECAIVVSDARASRKHARLQLEDGAPFIEDLGSSNGVFVNGQRVERRARLAVDDTVLVGQHELVVKHSSKRHDDRADTIPSDAGVFAPMEAGSPPSAPQSDFDVHESTRRADALSLIGTVADKAIALGNAQQAEQVLTVHLYNTLQQARVATHLPDGVCERSLDYALKLARATKKGGWIDYVFELAGASEHVLSSAMVDRLYEIVPQTSDVKLDRLRAYVAALRKRSQSLDSAGRFALRRLEGLERQLSAS